MQGLISFLMNNFLYLFLKVSYTQSFPPPLSPAEEAECFRLMQGGDKKAREKLIEHNLRLVAHIVTLPLPSIRLLRVWSATTADIISQRLTNVQTVRCRIYR